MSVTTDIVRTYRAPRQVVAGWLSGGEREDRAFAVLFAACLIIFVSRWPVAAREAYLDPSIPFDARVGGQLMALIFIFPLIAYGLAAVTHLLAKLVGGKGSWYGARIALFWALLAASPLWLLYGLTEGFIGPGPALTLTQVAALAAFLAFWTAGLWEAETKHRDAE